ncbi:hypothetical protein C7H19_13655 [Aphanothece hegewaldii CCALA 016]|uniref:Uncharacterized protein n=1 Tax=Aphanothece hegewaldii CCALA 016 TaxID=2107694 RepID=A0A2T1LWH2_9CHRO|nr:hypothetical protein [Aphanothece hegewaldii]PSF36248.1 hypothetical protein C7H19_13655 [Aphanothece hegewaldii CCALA 016]
MYKDKLLNFGGFSFSFKGGLWLLGALAWSVGLVDRIISILLDGHIVSQEILQLIIITAVLVSWFYLKPSSRLSGDFSTGIDEIINLESRNNLEPSLVTIKHDDRPSINPH